MDSEKLAIISPGVDFTQIVPIHQKRMLAFINYFLTNTVSFLNKFARSCEFQLEKFDSKLKKLEASICILESKLNSVSGLEEVCNAPKAEHHEESQKEKKVSEEINEEIDGRNEETKEVSVDPVNAKFLQMVKVGVPVQAVRLKMISEGLDPSALEEILSRL